MRRSPSPQPQAAQRGLCGAAPAVRVIWRARGTSSGTGASCALISRVSPEPGARPAGLPRAHAAFSSPRHLSLHHHNGRKPSSPLAGAEQLVVVVVVRGGGSKTTSPRAGAALTQSGEQEGFAPFLHLDPLLVARPEQGLEPGPGQRSLHLPHGQRSEGRSAG